MNSFETEVKQVLYSAVLLFIVWALTSCEKELFIEDYCQSVIEVKGDQVVQTFYRGDGRSTSIPLGPVGEEYEPLHCDQFTY